MIQHIRHWVVVMERKCEAVEAKMAASDIEMQLLREKLASSCSDVDRATYEARIVQLEEIVKNGDVVLGRGESSAELNEKQIEFYELARLIPEADSSRLIETLRVVLRKIGNKQKSAEVIQFPVAENVKKALVKN